MSQSITIENANEDQSPQNQMLTQHFFYYGSLACRLASPRCGATLTQRFLGKLVSHANPH